MAFSIFFSITVLLTISFAVTKKNLHLFEIFFIWMIVNMIHYIFGGVAFNLGKLDISGHPSHYWALVFNRIFLIPLLIIWYFDQTATRRPYTIWAWLPLGISILVGVEYLAEVLGLYIHIRWKLWWSFAEWFLIFLLVYFPWIWFRNLLRKEMK